MCMFLFVEYIVSKKSRIKDLVSSMSPYTCWIAMITLSTFPSKLISKTKLYGCGHCMKSYLRFTPACIPMDMKIGTSKIRSPLYNTATISSRIATSKLLSYCFSHNIMLTLFHDKKCCNSINLFLCILWDFFIMGLVLSWWRLIITIDLTTCSQLTHEWTTREMSHEKHMLEVEQSFAMLYFVSHFATRPSCKWPVKLFA